METWATITAILCIFGIFKEIRPSEPYLTEYLEGPWFNLTKSQVNHEIYPIWTYSYLVCLLIVLLVTDLVRYKPIIVVEAISYVITWSLLLWCRSLFAMQMMQAVYGIATSTEVAYFTYIYSVVSESMFQKVTGYARAALLFGRFLSGAISQTLISTEVLDFHTLNFVSFGCVLISFLVSMILPFPRRRLYSLQASDENQALVSCSRIHYISILKFMARELKKCYMDHNLLLWCLWWAVATSGNIQVGNYIQPLWETIHPTWDSNNSNSSSSSSIYNGAVEATHTLLSSAAAMAVGFIHSHRLELNEIFLGMVTFINCGLLIIMAWTKSIWIAYITYIGFRTMYQMVITIVSYQVARHIAPDTYGLIFGTNTFVALVLQTIMTVVFVDKSGLQLEPRIQFTVYSIYFGILALVFLILGIVRKCSSTNGSSEHIVQTNDINNETMDTEMDNSS